jgi:hypothetical protein
MKPITRQRIRKAASMLLFSARGNRDAQRGIRAMRDLLIAGLDIQRKYYRIQRLRKK